MNTSHGQRPKARADTCSIIALHLKKAQFPVTQARADASSAMPSSLPLLAASARALPSATPPSLIPFHV
jgi:hypothetical protein